MHGAQRSSSRSSLYYLCLPFAGCGRHQDWNVTMRMKDAV